MLSARKITARIEAQKGYVWKIIMWRDRGIIVTT